MRYVMADNDTNASQDGTQELDASASADATGDASQTGKDEVSVLQSRYAGQTAKVNELTQQKAALEAQIAQLAQERDDARSGVTSADEAAKALLAAKDDEIAQLLRANKVTALQARFPEVYAELGEDAVNLSEEKLAAMEARFQGGAAGSEEPPTPRGNNAARRDGVPTGGREQKVETADDVLASMRSMPLPAEWGG
jgi:hypothetical protein